MDRHTTLALAGDHPYADCDELRLLVAARDGDREAFEQLWLSNIVAARTFARHTLPLEIREEAVADAFLACWEAMLRGSGPTQSFRAYLFAAIRSRGISRLDKRAREELFDEIEVYDRAEPGGADSAFDEDVFEIVVRAFSTLTPRDRWALALSEIEGLPTAEVALRLDVTVNTAYQVVFRAKAKLRAKYLSLVSDDYQWAVSSPADAVDVLWPKSCPRQFK